MQALAEHPVYLPCVLYLKISGEHNCFLSVIENWDNLNIVVLYILLYLIRSVAVIREDNHCKSFHRDLGKATQGQTEQMIIGAQKSRRPGGTRIPKPLFIRQGLPEAPFPILFRGRSHCAFVSVYGIRWDT